MSEVIKVGMADLNLCRDPDIITTLGLGSCIGIALYDPSTKIGGLAHIMLPDSTKMRNNSNIAKFADTGIEELLNRMIKAGAVKSRLVAKIAGGAKKCRTAECGSFPRETKAAWNTADCGRYRTELRSNRRTSLR